MSDLREFVKKTFLLPLDVKKNILSINNWSDELKELIKSFYERYHLKERKILKVVDKKKLSFYLTSLRMLEEEHRKKEMEQLKKIEGYLNNQW